jgi:hypothetical protein
MKTEGKPQKTTDKESEEKRETLQKNFKSIIF